MAHCPARAEPGRTQRRRPGGATLGVVHVLLTSPDFSRMWRRMMSRLSRSSVRSPSSA